MGGHLLELAARVGRRRPVILDDRIGLAAAGSMPFLVEIANGSMGSRHLFEAAFQVCLQRGTQADQVLAAAHFA